MPRDYRHAGPPPQSKRKPSSKPCVWWLIVGVAIGVVVSNILSPKPDEPAATAGAQQAPPRSERPALAKPSFTFEEILSETEVDISKGPTPPPPAPRPQPPAPEQQTPPQQPPVAARPAPPPATPPQRVEPPPVATPEPTPRPRSGSYVVQVGSFSRPADAERLKAQLALLGVSTSVQAATLSSGRVTHRVRTGGFASREEAKKVQALLKRHGKDSIAIPIK